MSTRRKVSILCLIGLTGVAHGENDMDIVKHGPPYPAFEPANLQSLIQYIYP